MSQNCTHLHLINQSMQINWDENWSLSKSCQNPILTKITLDQNLNLAISLEETMSSCEVVLSCIFIWTISHYCFLKPGTFLFLELHPSFINKKTNWKILALQNLRSNQFGCCTDLSERRFFKLVDSLFDVWDVSFLITLWISGNKDQPCTESRSKI